LNLGPDQNLGLHHDHEHEHGFNHDPDRDFDFDFSLKTSRWSAAIGA